MASGSFADIPAAGALGITPGQTAALTGRALDLAASGALHPVIGQRFPLDRAADAHAAFEARATIGKTLLIANPERLSSTPA